MPNFESSNVSAMPINDLTVREFAALLVSLPDNLLDLKITYSGYNNFYIHHRVKENCLTLDEQEYID